MAFLPIGPKPERVLKFLIGCSNSRVARALMPYGFTDADLQQGWTLLRNLTFNKLDPLSTRIDQTLLASLDGWENKWFPVIEIVLRTHHPEVHAFVFRNLTQTEGSHVVVGVSTLLTRLEQIVKPAADGGFGDEGRAARDRLALRGANDETLGIARALLTQISTVGSLPEGPVAATPESTAEAEEALWAWYLEWSVITRTAITDRRLLRSLGFLRIVRRASGEVVEEIVTDDELDPSDVDVVEPNAPLVDPGTTDPRPR